jgi:hypothetical protein
VEQLFLERLNDARANPAAYGQTLGLDLSGVAASQPLAFDARIVEASRNHSWDMNVNNYFGHTGSDGSSPGQRITAAGFPWVNYGESLAAGYSTPEAALAALIIDTGIANLGHRRHLLAIDAVYQTQRQIGVGIVLGGTGPYRDYYTADSAADLDTRAFVTGVVYSDSNGNSKYDLGEGLGGVTVSVAGVTTTTTFDSGGYSLRLYPGTYTVTASGSGLGGLIDQAVTIGNQNVRLNFETLAPSLYRNYIANLFKDNLDRTPTSRELEAGVNLAQTKGLSLVANSIKRSTEAQNRLVRSLFTTLLGRSPKNYEIQGLVDALIYGGWTEELVRARLLSSSDYYNRTQATYGGNNVGFVKGLFQDLLGRAPTQAEIDALVSDLAVRGRDPNARFTMALGLQQNPEYRGQQIRSYYTTLLQRPAYEAEVAYWVTSGLDLATIQVFIEATREYFNRRK